MFAKEGLGCSVQPVRIDTGSHSAQVTPSASPYHRLRSDAAPASASSPASPTLRFVSPKLQSPGKNYANIIIETVNVVICTDNGFFWKTLF